MREQTRRLLLVVCVILAAALTFQASADAMGGFSPKKNTPSDAKSKVRKIEGRVASCDSRTSKMDIVTENGKLATVVIDKNTAISKDGKSLKIADIQWNDFVNVSYEADKGRNMAKSISIEKKPSPPPAKKSR